MLKTHHFILPYVTVIRALGSDLDLLYALDEKVTYWCAPHPTLLGGDVRWAVVAMVGCAGMLIPWKSANAINTNQHVLSCFADCSDLSK